MAYWLYTASACTTQFLPSVCCQCRWHTGYTALSIPSMRNLINVAIVILTKAWCTFYNIINFIYWCLWKLCHCFVIYRCAENSGLCSHWSINNISQCFESESSPFFRTHTNNTSHFVSISNLTDVLAITVALRWLAGHSSDQSNILSDSQCQAYNSKSTEIVRVGTEHRPSFSFIFF